MNISEAREILSDYEARAEMQKHKLELDVTELRSVTEYIAEIIVWVCALEDVTDKILTPHNRIDRFYHDGSNDRKPYFA